MTDFKFGSKKIPFSWPRGWDVSSWLPEDRPVFQEEGEIVIDALDAPFGSLPLAEVLDKDDRILVVVPDENRNPRLDVILPILLKRIQLRKPKRVEILVVGEGGVRPRVSDAFLAKLGSWDGCDDVHLHEPSEVVSDGLKEESVLGTTIAVNPLILEADKVIVVDQMNFHDMLGYTGGGEGVSLGASGWETVRQNRSLVFDKKGRRHTRAAAARMNGNPVFEDAQEIAQLLNPDFVINAVLGIDQRITRVFCGDVGSSHVEGSRIMMGFFRMRVPRKKTIFVSAGGAPNDDSFLSVMKGIQYWYRVVRPKGTLVVGAACTLGLGNDKLAKWLAMPPTEVRKVVANRESFDPLAYAVLCLREAQHHCRILLWSDMNPEEVRFTGCVPIKNLPEAFLMVRKDTKEGLPRVGWVPSANQTLGIPG